MSNIINKINEIKEEIKQKISDPEADNTNTLSLLRAIKRTKKYRDIKDGVEGIDDIEDKSELDSLNEIIDDFNFNLDTFEIDLDDTIQDIYVKIKNHVKEEDEGEYYEEYEENDEEKDEENDEEYNEKVQLKILLEKDIEYPIFDEAKHCDNNMDCFRVDISDIIDEEDKKNDVFTEIQVVYESNKGLQTQETTKSYDLITKFHRKLIDAIREMSDNYKIKKIKYRIQIDRGNYPDNERFSRGYYLHREKTHLLSFWVFQNINCENAGTVIAKRVEDNAHVMKIPDNMSFVLNDSIYLHKAPKQWEILNKSEKYVRSILVAEIELGHLRSNENVDHNLASLINSRDLKIGGIKTRKTKKTKKTRKTKKRKTRMKRKKTKRRSSK